MKKRSWRPALIPLSLLLLFGLYLLALQISGNIHEAVPGELYRSAQLPPSQLAETIDRYGIKSVLNLRGGHAGEAWYDDEVNTTTAHGAKHFDYRMSARRILEPKEAQKLIAIMKNAPKPILVHCRSGSDRSGLAAALYVAAIKKGTEQEAEQQLSIRYGHFSRVAKERAMDESLQLLKPSLGIAPGPQPTN